MATTAGTTPTAVRIEIDTGLEDSAIEDILARVEREIDRAYTAPSELFDDDQHRQDLESVLAALRIVEGRDRRAEEVQTGRSATTYEETEIAQLRKRVRRADPGTEFGHAGRIRKREPRSVGATE